MMKTCILALVAALAVPPAIAADGMGPASRENSRRALDWRSALAQELVSLQAADGSWVNKDSNAWREDKPQLVTAWCVIAFEHTLK